MRAFVVSQYKGPLQQADVPEPVVGEHDVLVQVQAAGLNMLDEKIRAGEFKQILPYKLPQILGNDVAGTVIGVGAKVRGFALGDEVYARPDKDRIGTFAERIAIAEADLALKPASVSLEAAASLPLVGLTAWQALVERGNVQPVQRVLIHAGAGGVGTIAIQLAKHLGATVATTVSTGNVDFVRELGADIVIDYRTQDFEQLLNGYDLVLDSLGGKNLEKSLRVLRPGGKAIGIAGPPDSAFARELGAARPSSAGPDKHHARPTEQENVMNTNDHVITAYKDAPARTVDANGVTYAYRELGPKGGIPVVFFVHLAATLDNWDPRIIDSIAAEHHVIAFDNRGVGASTGRVPDGVEAMADDAVTFIKALGYDKVDIFSFSLGGMIAQALMVKHPGLVRKLVLTGTGPAGGKDIDKVAGTTYYDILRATLTRSDPKEFLFFNRNATGKPAARAFVQRLEERTTDRDAPIALKGFQTQLKAIKKWGRSAPADLSKITQPTLIANGDNDRMVPSVLSEDLHRRIKNSELIIYPDSGHGGIFQYHEKFAPVAVEFLAR
ncbi:NADPH:quinone reductase-like Zn-dependent oxidoreductase [Kribbella orskensis]|uniref:NADPH:quinone reductase-like Zn-dependent oxidoreductase n=1 Tax=Kribbella orskensis TaxID=2512216 RepID=A0ABY2B7Z2_9ACTN|nr:MULTISPECIES: alpha/beta fold hydrolase [Kribbella]TCN30636.1 NADPH:quinone reductase-like Zn-dependent oxidoreductase [Kribbella sp. VKM Ac-2500]TCO11355.1 NADPH:quinone reductase-like Zn-dependent oxidoreductase [Kribbella orskensis]